MKYIALRHDTLEGAGTKKDTLEVDLGDTFTADPEHPQVIRALRVGSIQAVEVPATKEK